MSAPIDKLLEQEVDWEEIDPKGFVGRDGTRYATHKGVLEIGAAKLRVYHLNDGQRYFDADDVAAFFTPPPVPDGRS